MWENAYLSIKNPKASRALKWALDPSRKLLASLAQLRFATSAIFGLSTWGPPLDQILDPHLWIYFDVAHLFCSMVCSYSQQGHLVSKFKSGAWRAEQV